MKYQHYLLIICAYSPESLEGPSICDIIESRLTFLIIKKFETLKFIKYFHINPKALFKRENCPEATNIKEKDWKCTGWGIGFKIKKEKIKENNIIVQSLKDKIKSLKENDLKKYIKVDEEEKIKIGASYLNEKNFEKFIKA
uniref:Poly(A) polymerase RNA-binding domain-containing protein n=1 Tax=Meloidogyne floridensis TaxID=298350 RepID=A0A915NHD4_9BILA